MSGRFRASLPAVVAVLWTLVAGGLWAAPAPDGRRELDLGREAYAQRDYAAAVLHLQAAVQALDRERERPSLADAYLDLGLSYMAGLGDPERALAALSASAELAENPTNALLLAAAAAEKLGRAEEAAALRDRALHPAPVAAPPAPPAPAAFDHVFKKPTPETPAPAPPPGTF